MGLLFRTKWGCVGPFVVLGCVATVMVLPWTANNDLTLIAPFFLSIVIGFAVDALVTVVMRVLGYPPPHAMAMTRRAADIRQSMFATPG